ncbi:MAG: cytochrome P460 family protein [Rubricoccaceae bacterium]|nr:cytochrome P460 family protein [Rubricoccaceae bacterium]
MILSRQISIAIVATLLITGLAVIASGDNLARAQSAQDWGPSWTTDGELRLPSGFHQWVYLGSPLTPHALNGGNAPFPEYHNVYVQPEAFAAYRKTGEWPEGTIMFKELQLARPATNPDGSSVEVSGRGYFPGALNGVDISVKDSGRFKDSNGWGFFTFGHHAPPYPKTAAVQPIEACAGCHIANADDMVFSKFYSPILDSKDAE